MGGRETLVMPVTILCVELSNLDKEFLVLLEGLKKPLSVSEGWRVRSRGISKCSYLYRKTKFRAQESLRNFHFQNMHISCFYESLEYSILSLVYFREDYICISILNPFDVPKELTFLRVLCLNCLKIRKVFYFYIKYLISKRRHIRAFLFLALFQVIYFYFGAK